MTDEELNIKIKVDKNEVKKAIASDTDVKGSPLNQSKQAINKGPLGKATQGMNIAKGAAQNPMGSVMDMFGESGFIGKQLMKFLPIKEVIKVLTSVGGPFDKRFRRIIKKEVNGFFTREEQNRKRLGLDPVIMTTVGGFRNNGGLQTVNTLNQVGKSGVATIGLTEKAQGVQ